jgi:hypothetical protein
MELCAEPTVFLDPDHALRMTPQEVLETINNRMATADLRTTLLATMLHEVKALRLSTSWARRA